MFIRLIVLGAKERGNLMVLNPFENGTANVQRTSRLTL